MVNKSKGFTLIELLVVIAIIGVLASIVLASVSTARAKARDAKRISEIRQIETALQMYHNDNGRYPPIAHGLGFDTTCGGSATLPLIVGCGHCQRWCALETALAPYIKKLPRDPLGTAQATYYYAYSSNSNDQMYGLMVVLESPNRVSQNDSGYYPSAFERGPRPSYCTSKYTGGNAEWLNAAGAWSNVCVGGN